MQAVQLVLHAIRPILSRQELDERSTGGRSIALHVGEDEQSELVIGLFGLRLCKHCRSLTWLRSLDLQRSRDKWPLMSKVPVGDHEGVGQDGLAGILFPVAFDTLVPRVAGEDLDRESVLERLAQRVNLVRDHHDRHGRIEKLTEESILVLGPGIGPEQSVCIIHYDEVWLRSGCRQYRQELCEKSGCCYLGRLWIHGALESDQRD